MFITFETNVLRCGAKQVTLTSEAGKMQKAQLFGCAQIGNEHAHFQARTQQICNK